MLTGKTAWITGATGGVGPAMVRVLAGAGAAGRELHDCLQCLQGCSSGDGRAQLGSDHHPGARAAVAGRARSGAYAASKAALMALTESIAAETKQTGVTANCLLLSTVDTPANRASAPGVDYGRWVTPEQIAAAVRFLCEDQAASINGAAIPIYGRV